jgi:arsenate reductase-like glutaredoxin family protein
MSNTEEKSANAFEDVNVEAAGNANAGNANAGNANAGNANEANANVENANVENANEANANAGNNNEESNNSNEEYNNSENAEESAAPAPVPVPVPVPATVSKTGRPLSVAQAGLQERRSKTLEDMRAAYKDAFGDDKKAPKAKAYHAAGLTTIRERDGENAFQAKLQEHIAENRSKYEGKPTRKTAASKGTTATQKAANATTSKKATAKPKNSAKLLNSASTGANGKAASTIIDSIEGMGATARELIQTMVTTTKALAKELSKSNSANSLSAIAASAVSRNSSTMKNSAATTGRKTRSNKGGHHKKHKKGRVLPPIPE